MWGNRLPAVAWSLIQWSNNVLPWGWPLTKIPGPPPKLHLELALPQRVTLSAPVLGWMVSSPREAFVCELISQQVSGYWTVPSPPPPKAQPSLLLPLFSPQGLCLAGRGWDSGLALVSLSDLNEGGWTFAGVVPPAQRIPFFFLCQPLTGSLLGGRERGKERLSLVTKRQPAEHK